MSNLWDVAQARPSHDIVVPGETIPELFWNAAAKRRDWPEVWARASDPARRGWLG